MRKITSVVQAPYCFAKSHGKQKATGSNQALKGFLAIKKARVEDPGSPEKLYEAGYRMFSRESHVFKRIILNKENKVEFDGGFLLKCNLMMGTSSSTQRQR